MPGTTYRELSADNVVIELNVNPTQFDDLSELPPNHNTDHILEADWDIETGWSAPYLHGFRPMLLDPTSSFLHYATTCFEGMKAYKSADGKKITLFRPRDNIDRLNDSTERASLPFLEPEAALKLLDLFVQTDSRFIAPGGYIYLRPMVMGTDGGLGLKSPSRAKFMIMASLMPPLNRSPLKLYCSPPDCIRAWPGGFGYAKLGANYGPTLAANREAVKNGYSQVLWLFGENGVVTEAGGANFFAVIKNEEGRTQILTCPLTTGLILPGVTRRSVLELLTEKFSDEIDVIEREFTISEIAQAAEQNRLVEAFAVGTAYFVSSVDRIRTPEGVDFSVPLVEEDGLCGKYAKYARDALSAIMWGKVQHKWAHIVKEN